MLELVVRLRADSSVRMSPGSSDKGNRLATVFTKASRNLMTRKVRRYSQ
jgi:hypothetical protein